MTSLVKLDEKIDQKIHSKVSLIKQPYVVHLDPEIRNQLVSLQLKGFPCIAYRKSQKLDLDRFSLVQKVHTQNKIIIPTAAILEGKKVIKAWNVNYMSHGWHRYVGRFPPQIVRSLLNIFRIMPGDVVLDPFLGSGTTLVECKLLGIDSVGVEINPLSHMISRTKIKLDFNDITLLENWNWIQDEFSSNSILSNHKKFKIPDFPNIDKWFNEDVLDQLTNILTLVQKVPKNMQDFFYLAISAGMRSMGNVDVDVVRSEYRKTPRENVDVLNIMNLKLKKYIQDIQTFKKLQIPKSNSKIFLKDFRKQKIEPESIDFIITSPPYGIESISYLRTHMLSYRVLQNVLNTSVDELKSKMIGTDFIMECDLKSRSLVSKTAEEFLGNFLQNTKSDKTRVSQTIQYFQDMEEVFEKMTLCLKKNHYCVVVIGNKKLLEKTIPTHKIFSEIAKYYGLKTKKIIPSKLICNNTTAKTPWSDKAITEENLMIFQK